MRSFAFLSALLVLSSLSLPASPAFAEEAAAELEPLLAEGSVSTLCPALEPAETQIDLAAAGQCQASADCEDGSTRSCTDTSSPYNCSAVDQNCDAGIQGWAQCNGQPKQYCPTCQDCSHIKQCNPCGNAPPTCGCICVRGACGRIDAWVCL